ncbi:MAG: hypothetical protein HY040_13390 [Planctomycetes bacterium]|nr:hypothetical protein [Planctomycetota bacterium]
MTVEIDSLKGLSMPRFSWDYEDCSEAEHWFLTACAYQECACHVLSEMIEKRLSSSFHHAKVAAYLFLHAVELFLKGGIANAGKTVPSIHPLDKLYGQFRKLYSGKAFEFTGSIDDIAQPSSKTPHNEFPRYPTNHSGQPWEGNCHFDLVKWFDEASRFLEDIKRLEPLIKHKYRV